MRLLLSIALSLMAIATQAAIVTTNVTGNVNGFNPGPFSGSDPISLSFEWDTTAVADENRISDTRWFTAVKNISLDIGGHTITGTDTIITQRNNTTDDQISITLGTYLGNTYGTVTGGQIVNGYTFESFSLVFRSIDLLFPNGTDDTRTLISAPSADMFIASLTIRFDDFDAGTFYDDVLNPHNLAFTMNSNAVPTLPGIAFLAIGLSLLRRARTQISR